jgi:D-lyxose ketol-isomerase
MRDAIAFIEFCRFHLPRFAFWTAADWEAKGPEADEIRGNGLGWDITDFGSGDFNATGLFLFTIRNGLKGSGRNYAEKIMIVEEGQVTPMHFHFDKTEDIINRGGGRLVIELYNANENEELADSDIEVVMDGVVRTVPAGGNVILEPGDSITLVPRLYHTFYGAEGAGKVLVGEVSSVNDDAVDNRFHKEVGRFPEIEEDEPALYPLCFEYV